VGGILKLQLNLRSARLILTLHQKQIDCRAVQYDSAFGGEDSDSDMDMGDDYMHTYTLPFSLSFSLFPSFSLTHSLSLDLSQAPFSSVSLLVSLFHTHRYMPPFFFLKLICLFDFVCLILFACLLL